MTHSNIATRVWHRLAPVILFALVDCSLQRAQAGTAVDVFDPPAGHLSIQPMETKHSLYGSDTGLARWHIGQWNNPGGDIPDLRDGHSSNGSMSLTINEGPPVSYVITQDGDRLRCSDGGPITEFDGFIGTNTRRNNPSAPSAEAHVGAPIDLAHYSSLTQEISLTVQAAAFVGNPVRCSLSKAVSFVCVVLDNTRRHSTLFYQVLLYAFGTDPRPVWWARGNEGGRYGYNDLVVSFGHTMVSSTIRVRYEFDVLPRLRHLIESNTVGMDRDPADWYISGAYFGNSLWGNVRLSTEWTGYTLRAMIQ